MNSDFFPLLMAILIPACSLVGYWAAVERRGEAVAKLIGRGGDH